MPVLRWMLGGDIHKAITFKQKDDIWELVDFCRWLRHPDTRHFVAEIDHQVVGYVIAVGKVILKIGAQDESVETVLRQRIAR